jgi:hypothetical protein
VKFLQAKSPCTQVLKGTSEARICRYTKHEAPSRRGLVRGQHDYTHIPTQEHPGFV